jgi:hypothetical protein
MITSFILKGHGIYQVAAMSGTHKSGIAYEPEQKYLDSGMARIEKSTEKLVSKGKLSSEDAAAVLGRVDFTTDVTKLKDVDFVCEAVIENMYLKKGIYKELSEVRQPVCFLVPTRVVFPLRKWRKPPIVLKSLWEYISPILSNACPWWKLLTTNTPIRRSWTEPWHGSKILAKRVSPVETLLVSLSIDF